MGSLRHAIRGHALFAKRLAISFVIGLLLILASLLRGYAGLPLFRRITLA
jgi:hypothetical protein